MTHCDLCGHHWAYHLNAHSDCAVARDIRAEQHRALRPEST